MELSEILGEEKYAAALEKSLLLRGNNARITAAFAKDKIRLCFFGGSVTFGYNGKNADNSGCFPELLTAGLREKYPHKCIIGENLGISGTACAMGLIQAARLTESSRPDIAFVEYAVNEERSADGAARFEGLVRRLLTLGCAAIPIAVFSREGYSCEEFMLHVARHYDLFFAGLSSGVYPLFAENLLPWEAYSHDSGHPTREGHRLIADCVLHLLEAAVSTDSASEYSLPKGCISDRFAEVKAVPLADVLQCSDTANKMFPTNVNATTVDYSNGATVISCKCGFAPADKQLFTFEGIMNTPDCGHVYSARLICKNIIIAFIQKNSAQTGSAEVLVDGVRVDKLQGYSVFGWENPITRIVLDETTEREHELMIRMVVGDERKEFVILAICAG